MHVQQQPLKLTLCLFLACAATNMLAISFARKDKELASAILSDALAIAAVLGCFLAAAMYLAAPAYLARLAGQASATIVGPAVTYVRIRCADGCSRFESFCRT
jgi:Na+-driven multidrug efflux pump